MNMHLHVPRLPLGRMEIANLLSQFNKPLFLVLCEPGKITNKDINRIAMQLESVGSSNSRLYLTAITKLRLMA